MTRSGNLTWGIGFLLTALYTITLDGTVLYLGAERAHFMGKCEPVKVTLSDSCGCSENSHWLGLHR